MNLHITNNQEKFLIETLRKEWEEIERSVKKHEMKQGAKIVGRHLTKALLTLLIIGGTLTVAAIAPNILAAFGKTLGQRRFFQKSNLKKSLYNAKRQSYIKFKKMGNDNYTIEITDIGKKRILKETLNNLKVKKVSKWDEKWRMVIFDIPRKHNGVRNLLREKLKKMGLYQLQESVFISPYSCKEEVELWANLYNADKFIHIIEAESISNLDSSLLDLTSQ